MHLTPNLPIEGAVRIELEEGVPIFRAFHLVQEQIEALLVKQKLMPLNPEEKQELDGYEAIDDYLCMRTWKIYSRWLAVIIVSDTSPIANLSRVVFAKMTAHTLS